MGKRIKIEKNTEEQGFSGMTDPRAYLEKRKNNPVLKYRMNKRLKKIVSAIRQWDASRRQGHPDSAIRSQRSDEKGMRLLDVGAADGRTLTLLRHYFAIDKAVGLEPCAALREACHDRDLLLLSGQGEHLPFKDNGFDVVVVASVIEHVSDARKLMQECYRVLDNGGILVVSAVDPFLDKLASRLGIKQDDHIETFTLHELRVLFKNARFHVTVSEKFGLISLGLLPFEEKIEKLFNKYRLYFTMYYQLVVGKK